MIKVKDISLIAYARSIGKTNTARLTFGDMLFFENYITGYRRKEQHNVKKGKKERSRKGKSRTEKVLSKILNGEKDDGGAVHQEGDRVSEEASV